MDGITRRGLARNGLGTIGGGLLTLPPLRAAAQDPSGPLARPPAGALRGTSANGVLAFKGIPYAAPPVGPRRFRSPAPAPRWEGERPATRAGMASLQTIPPWAAWLYDRPAAMGEDCLSLNVWTPSLEGRRPVMLWIHGGAWRTGEGAAAGNDGTHLARTGDVVVVTVNYRLGALGFLAHPALKDPETGAFANWGVQDQAAALRWVRENVAAFGGDPDNITLFGQSAGGTSVANLAQNPDTAGMVRRMIIQSGALFGPPAQPTVEDAAGYAEELARRLGTGVTGLRDVPAQTLHMGELLLAREWQAARGRGPIAPVMDGVVVRAVPREAPLPPVPLLIGSTRDEGLFWFGLKGPDGKEIPGLPAPADDAQLLDRMPGLIGLYRPGGNAPSAGAAIAAYRASASAGGGGRPSPREVWAAAYRDLLFRLDARDVAARHAVGNPTFLYEFAHELVPPAGGVPHCAEIPFVFGTNVDPYFAAKSGTGPAEEALARATMQAWARFARDGVPSADEGGAWTRLSATGEGVNILGGKEGVRTTVPAVRPEETALWRG